MKIKYTHVIANSEELSLGVIYKYSKIGIKQQGERKLFIKGDSFSAFTQGKKLVGKHMML